MQKQDWSWSNLIKTFDFNPEFQKIHNFLNNIGTQDADPLADYITLDNKAQVLRMLSLHPAEFDFKTVLKFFKQISLDQSTTKFEHFWLLDCERVKNIYNTRFMRYVDAEKYLVVSE